MTNRFTELPEGMAISEKAAPEFLRYCSDGDDEIAVIHLIELHLEHIMTILQREKRIQTSAGGVFITDVKDFDLAVVDIFPPLAAHSPRETMLATRAECQSIATRFIEKVLRQYRPDQPGENEHETLH